MNSIKSCVLAALAFTSLALGQAGEEAPALAPESYWEPAGTDLYIGVLPDWAVRKTSAGTPCLYSRSLGSSVQVKHQRIPAGYDTESFLKMLQDQLRATPGTKILQAKLEQLGGRPGLVVEYVQGKGYTYEANVVTGQQLLRVVVSNPAASERPPAKAILATAGWGKPPTIAPPPPPPVETVDWEPEGSGLKVSIPGWKLVPGGAWLEAGESKSLMVGTQQPPGDPEAYRKALIAWQAKARVAVVRERALKVADWEALEIVTRPRGRQGLQVEVLVFQGARLTVLEFKLPQAEEQLVDELVSCMSRAETGPAPPVWEEHALADTGWSLSFPSKPATQATQRASQFMSNSLFTGFTAKVFPFERPSKKSLAQVLDWERESGLRHGIRFEFEKPKKVKAHRVSWQRYELTGDRGQGETEQRIYWVGVAKKRGKIKPGVVLISYVGGPGAANDADAERFFESLRPTPTE